MNDLPPKYRPKFEKVPIKLLGIGLVNRVRRGRSGAGSANKRKANG